MKKMLSLILTTVLLLSAVLSPCKVSHAEAAEEVHPGSFTNALAKAIDNVDLEKNDYRFSMTTPQSSYNGILSMNDGVYSFSLGDLGSIGVSEKEIILKNADEEYVVDLTQLSSFIRSFSSDQSFFKEDISLISSLAQKLWSDAILPFIHYSFTWYEQSVHIDLDDVMFFEHLVSSVDDIMKMKQFEQLYDKYAQILRPVFDFIPSDYQALSTLWDETKKNLIFTQSSIALNADLIIDRVSYLIEDLIFSGCLQLRGINTYDFNLVLKGKKDPGGLLSGWNLKLDLGGLMYSSTQISADLTFQLPVLRYLQQPVLKIDGTLEVNGNPFIFSTTQTADGFPVIHLDTNQHFSSDVTIRDDGFEALMYYWDDVIRFTGDYDDNLIHVSLKSTCGNWGYTDYNYDLWLYLLENNNVRLQLSGREKRSLSIYINRDYKLMAEFGQSVLDVKYRNFLDYVDGWYNLLAEKKGDGFVFKLNIPTRILDYSIGAFITLPWHLEIEQNDDSVNASFSYPYRSYWLIQGNAKIDLSKDHRINHIDGTVITSYRTDPEKKETRHLVYSPGYMSYKDGENNYTLEKTIETDSLLQYELKQNSKLMSILKAEIYEVADGNKLKAALTNNSNELLIIEIEPIYKENNYR